MTVLTLAGKPVDFANPPKSSAKCTWSKKTTGGKTVTGSFRTICWLEQANAAVIAHGFKSGINVIQGPYNSTVKASAGTHDYDGCMDVSITGASWRDAEKLLRSLGFGCWFRFPPKFGYHIHGFVIPPQVGNSRADDFKDAGTQVGIYVDGGVSLHGKATTSSQLTDYYNHAFGLASEHASGSDKAWYPANIKSTIFDLNAFVKARSWAPNPKANSTLAKVQEQFQIVQGVKKGTVARMNGVGVIQQALAAHGISCTVDGICGKATVAAWKTWETKHGGTGAKGTPDPTSLKALGIAARFVGPQAK